MHICGGNSTRAPLIDLHKNEFCFFGILMLVTECGKVPAYAPCYWIGEFPALNMAFNKLGCKSALCESTQLYSLSVFSALCAVSVFPCSQQNTALFCICRGGDHENMGK